MSKPQYIERWRQLPYNGSLLVQKGDWVNEEDVVGQLDYLPGTIRRITGAAPLRVDGPQLPAQMLLPEGAQVNAGDPLAAMECFGDRRVVYSPCHGYIGLVSRTLGYIYIREPIPVGDSEPVVFNVLEELGIKPLFLSDHLRVRQHDSVLPEQVIAVGGSAGKRRIIKSPIYGRVTSIEDGKVTIAPTHVSTDLTAYVAGKVVRVVPGQGVTVGSYARVFPGQYGVGGERGGELLIAAEAGNDLCPAAVSANWQGKVVVGRGTADLLTLQQAAAAGARAMVLGYLPLDTLQRYAETSTLGLTGGEPVAMPVILITGFLPSPIPEGTWNTLQSLQGRYASVNGTTHVRAGAIRPEIVVSEREWPPSLVTRTIAPAEPELAVGVAVRITRAPWTQRTGVVTGLPVGRQRIATGSEVRVAKVQLDEGIVTVPVSNLAVLAPEEGMTDEQED